MKKAFVYAMLCALALAVPAAAERIYVPVMGTAAGDGSALATSVWVTDAEGKGLLRPAATRHETGLMTLDADESQDVSAWAVGAGNKIAAEVPVFTDREAYAPGVDVLLVDLPRPKAMTSLMVGAANLSQQRAFCSATLYARNGSILAEVPFEVAPLSFAREDAFARAGKLRVAEVRVTCDQSFYPVGAATEGNKPQVIFAKASGPNGPCNFNVTLTQQTNGDYVAKSPEGIFHSANRNTPKSIICVRVPQELRLAKARFEWDVTVGPWSQKNPAGMHNFAYYFLERYRSGVVGNINAAGGKKRLIKFMQNVGMPRGSNTNVKAGYELQKDKTYHFIYIFDAASKMATLQTFLNGTEVNRISREVRPGGQQLVLKPYAKEGLAMVAEFGNFNNQHNPEMPSWGWKFANWEMTATLKKSRK